ncbi:GtrA family protein [Undibacterium sp. FT137W]|uniref:GtrA family protein n=2 Tax=Undibacterium fentianense TaxID=2828728 RepID=A0A941E5Z5_9BURK|nr:GtrA family protein [Undibacterium fentianense]
MNQPAIYQFIRFAAVGLSGTAVQYLSIHAAVMWHLSLFEKSSAVTGSAIGYILGSIVNYVLNYFLTFSSGKSHAEAASKYFTVLGVGWCINYGMMSLLVERWQVWLWSAQIFTTGLVLCWNFAGSKLWAFKDQ